MGRAVRVGGWVMAGLVMLALAGVLAMWLWMRGSLPMLEGRAVVAGLQQPVLVERDDLGTVTITAASEADAMRALGHVHAQERYFEMDLMRRSAAGELSALVGAAALPLDRRVRVHRMRARVEHLYAGADPDERVLLDAYAEGANAGLQSLRTRPWAYGLLRTRPEPWRPEDALLVGYAMFFDLQDSHNQREWALLQARRHIPDAVVDLLARDGSHWDAPLQGTARASLAADELVALLTGGADTSVDAPTGAGSAEDEQPAKGSNNFAVSGALTGDGRALVADDMHLGLRAPNIWFRARLRYPAPDAPGGRVDVAGVTLPGLPGVVVGSSGHVAWGFTNSYGDYHDFIRVHWSDRDAGRYRTPDGEADVARHVETLHVLRGTPETLEVLDTRWGPILHEDGDTSLALAWAAHRPGSLDLGLLRMPRAADTDAAIAIANRAGVPAQNVVIGDVHGRIAWTLMGRLPNRVGDCDPLLPLDPVAEGCDWDGWLDPDAVPRVVDPGSGRLWTANSRVADGADLALVGDGGYDLGARQRQIRDALEARERFTETDLLDIQLDHRALFLEPWWRLLRDVSAHAGPEQPGLQALAGHTAEWEGEARADAVSYRLVRAFRAELVGQVVDSILEPARTSERDAFLAPRVPQAEAFVWPLVIAQPSDWTPHGHASWPDAFEAAARSAVEALGGEDDLSQRSWGERNTARIQHPLAAALPRPLARRLAMPPDPLPGDAHLPRAQSGTFGASQRMVVAPGAEHRGIMQMPGGQSGHPLSPFWGSGHADWVAGTPTPFLPGPPRFELRLEPESKL